MSTEYCPACGRLGRPSDRHCRGCGGALFDTPDGADEALTEAQALVTAGRLDDAIVALQCALGEAPAPERHVALATLYLRRDGPSAAMRELHRALDMDPRCGVAHAYIGGLFSQMGRVSEAEDALARARECAPRDLLVSVKHAEHWLRLGIFDRARIEVRAGLMNGGGSPETRAIAQELLMVIEKRARGSFIRATVSLPTGGRRVTEFFRRGRTAAPADTLEVL